MSTLAQEGRATRYADLTRAQACLALVLLGAVALWFQLGTLSAASDGTPPERAPAGRNDLDLYRAVVKRVSGGEGYYDVVGSELRARGYPVRPILNFRQPTYAWLLSRFPDPRWANVLMASVAAVVVGLSFLWMRNDRGPVRRRVAVGLVAIAMTSCLIPEYALMQESWAALFIVLSLCCHAVGCWPAAVGAGLIALAFRELAVVPCLVSLLWALYDRRRPEVIAWLVGLALYAVLMAWHAHEASLRVHAGDIGRGWVALGGSGFLVAAGRWNPLSVDLPKWAVALVLPLSLFGLAGWKDRTAARILVVVVAYFTAFTVVGHPFNNYWGILYGPLLLPFGLPWVVDSGRDLWRALLARPEVLPAR
jgi:hypothetical protein